MNTRRHQYRFYAQIVVLNIAVFSMLRVVTLPLPQTPVQSIAVPSVPPISAPVITQGVPARIVVADLGIDLPVGVGSYNSSDQTWTLSDDSAYYADVSVPANNNNGTTLIYGHAKPAVFGLLADLQPSARAEIHTENGYVFHYNYRSSTQVSPYDTSVFTENGPPILTLQTCTGIWDEHRAMYMFEFVGEEKL